MKTTMNKWVFVINIEIKMTWDDASDTSEGYDIKKFMSLSCVILSLKAAAWLKNREKKNQGRNNEISWHFHYFFHFSVRHTKTEIYIHVLCECYVTSFILCFISLSLTYNSFISLSFFTSTLNHHNNSFLMKPDFSDNIF